MKISYNWIKQFIKTDWTTQQTSELLTDLGLEVEGITNYESVKGGLKGVVVGHVLTCVQHPNADRLKITTVNIGENDPLQIVCGAPNAREGLITIYAPPGSVIPKTNFELKIAKIRG